MKDSTKNSGTLVVTDGDTPRTELTIAYLEEPSHGKLSIDADGYFLYVPDTGYTGDDSFVIEISDGKHSTGRVTIQLKIVETLMPLSKAGSALTGTRIVRFADKASTQTAGDGIYEVAVSAEGKVISAAYGERHRHPGGRLCHRGHRRRKGELAQRQRGRWLYGDLRRCHQFHRF